MRPLDSDRDPRRDEQVARGGAAAERVPLSLGRCGALQRGFQDCPHPISEPRSRLSLYACLSGLRCSLLLRERQESTGASICLEACMSKGQGGRTASWAFCSPYSTVKNGENWGVMRSSANCHSIVFPGNERLRPSESYISKKFSGKNGMAKAIA
jgi:hypothetical protein